MSRISFEQLSLFNSSEPDRTEESSTLHKSSDVWQLFIDGAARRNPGPAGAGVYILKNGVPLYQDGYYLGEKTNNQAEYIALLIGLFFIEQWKKAEDSMTIYSDSQLLVRQVLGIYRVKNAHLHRLHQIQADLMANRGIDTRKALPSRFIMQMRAYGNGIL
jgi:ribonuclease HI